MAKQASKNGHIREFLKRHKKWIISLVIIAFIIGAGFAAAKGKNGATEVTAEMRTVVQEVAVSGKVDPVSSVDLAFEETGKISSVFVAVGTKIQKGTRIAALESSELAANLLKAKANLASERATLEEMRNGTRPEEILVYEAKALNASLTLSDAGKNLEDKLADAFTKADDAVRSKVDQFFSGPGSATPQLNFTVSSGALEAQVESGRVAAEVVLNSWATVTIVPVTDSVISTVQGNLLKIQSFLATVASMVNSLTASPTLTQATIDAYRADVSTARTNVNTAISNLSSAIEKWNNAKTSLAVAEKELALKRAGSTPEAIRAEEAKVEVQRAEVASIEARLAKRVLTSPISGTISYLEVKPGEIVSSGTKVASVISEDQLEIEAYVSEVNVGKVAVGNPVRIALDAFPGESFPGKITYLELSETLIDGVVSFKLNAMFDALDARLKSGLTANIYIETAKREHVVAIPRFAITAKDGKFFVTMHDAEGEEFEREVTLGLLGIDGFQEVLSGLQAGEAVLVKKK